MFGWLVKLARLARFAAERNELWREHRWARRRPVHAVKRALPTFDIVCSYDAVAQHRLACRPWRGAQAGRCSDDGVAALVRKDLQAGRSKQLSQTQAGLQIIAAVAMEFHVPVAEVR